MRAGAPLEGPWPRPVPVRRAASRRGAEEAQRYLPAHPPRRGRTIPGRTQTSTAAPAAQEDGMAIATAEPYRAYLPKPFTRAERGSVTVLIGGLHWRLERLFQAL